MLRLFRYALLTSLLSATVLYTGAQKYEREWNKVDSLIGNYDQVNSIEAVRQIMDKAQADGNCREILRCALMINRLDAPFSNNEDYIVQSYQLFDSLVSVMDDNALIVVSENGDELAPVKQYLIDKILIATPEQLEKIKSIINLVMQ